MQFKAINMLKQHNILVWMLFLVVTGGCASNNQDILNSPEATGVHPLFRKLQEQGYVAAKPNSRNALPQQEVTAKPTFSGLELESGNAQSSNQKQNFTSKQTSSGLELESENVQSSRMRLKMAYRMESTESESQPTPPPGGMAAQNILELVSGSDNTTQFRAWMRGQSPQARLELATGPATADHTWQSASLALNRARLLVKDFPPGAVAIHYRPDWSLDRLQARILDAAKTP